MSDYFSDVEVDRATRLLEFESVRQWLAQIRQQGTGSEATREAYLIYLLRFLDWSSKKGYFRSPDDLLSEARVDVKKVDFRLTEYFEYLEIDRKLARSTATYRYSVPRSFLSAHGLSLPSKYPEVWTKRKRELPTKDQLEKILSLAEPRLRAQILCQKDSGLPNEDLMRLRFGDGCKCHGTILEQLKSDQKFIHLEILREKKKVWFDSFFGSEAIEALKIYLDQRRKGTYSIPPEEVSEKSPLWRSRLKDQIIAQPKKHYEVDFWKKARQVGFEWMSPYLLRKYFNTTMKMAGVNDTVVEYWMGHKIPSQKKAYFIPSVEKQIELYLSNYYHLSLKPQTVTKEQAALEAMRKIAEPFGIDPMRIRIEKQRELQREPTPQEELTAIQLEIKRIIQRPKENNRNHKIVNEEELITHLNQGWELLHPVNGKFLIRKIQ